MKRADRYQKFIAYFSEHQPVAETELVYENTYQLLVSVILSAQCTDKRVNLTTPALFVAFPTAEVMAASSQEEIFRYIKSISYPNNKAKHLLGMAKMLMNDFGGVVPDDVELLQKLPGVGRKTANVIASVVFNQASMPVDTHVFRVAARIGLTVNAKTPRACEDQLVKHLPKEKIPIAHHWLILHGRYVCIARKPKCEVCGITGFCKYFNTELLSHKKAPE